MEHWSRVAAAIAATSRTSQKTSLLADYLRSLTPAELPWAVTFMTGRPFPERDNRTPGIGWAALGGVAEELVEAPPGALSAAYNASSDLGQAVGDLFAQYEHLPEGEPPTVPEVGVAFEQIAAARGAAAKAEVLRGLLARCDAWCARSVAKILSGDLRIGLRSGHLEAAIATAFDVPLADVQWAGMLTGDLGHTAELARDGRLATAELVLFRPLKSMLASPVADEAEALRRMAPPVWVEDKYDGIRAQLHKQGDDVRLYSRDMNEVTSGYPEVVEAARRQAWDGILDGELLAWRNGSALPFQLLQTRLGRKAPAAALIATVPVIFVAFDILAFGAGGGAPVEPLLRLSLRERRGRLDALNLADQPGFGVSQLITTSTEDELGQIFDEARVRGNEGLMVKDPDSTYSPGRRGYGWIKLKRALTTLDCVVVGVEVGHGKRHGVLSDYTFAVLDDRPGRDGRLATIGKAYSGLTDAELAEMTVWFKEHTLQQMGRFHVVEPTTVLEVAFDVIQPSNRHDSGYALRFPRIVRLRPDKQPAEIDTLSTVAKLAAALAEGGQYRVTAREARVVPAPS
jgi:ATP-dependent DNA ligase